MGPRGPRACPCPCSHCPGCFPTCLVLETREDMVDRECLAEAGRRTSMTARDRLAPDREINGGKWLRDPVDLVLLRRADLWDIMNNLWYVLVYFENILLNL